ncbi:MAG: outer membrane beta-barrel protein [Bdellovibrionales bacterium]
MLKSLLNLVALGVFAVLPLAAHADDSSKHLDIPGLRVAQFDADDTYDPFADYSEFDEAQEEEADINFFRHGRFVTIGFIGGLRGFTGGMGNLYTTAPSFGLFLSYFFDLRFALQFSFNTSDHAFHVESVDKKQQASGTIGITNFALDMKYYINTQNVTKGLAKFNPYFIAGFSRVDRTTHIENIAGFGKEGAMGFDLGAGIEFPMLRNKMYFGGQALYQMVNFQDKNTAIEFDGHVPTNKYPNGDSYTLMGIIGVNF